MIGALVMLLAVAGGLYWQTNRLSSQLHETETALAQSRADLDLAIAASEVFERHVKRAEDLDKVQRQIETDIQESGGYDIEAPSSIIDFIGSIGLRGQ